MSENKEKALTRGLPMLALRGLTAFPGMLLTFDIERPMSMAALNFAMGADQNIFLVTQKDVVKDIPAAEDLFSVGTVCRIRQQLKQPNGTSARIMAEWFKASGMPLTVVANKCDKLKKSEIGPNLALIRETLALPESVSLIPFSAQNGAGRDTLMNEILHRV